METLYTIGHTKTTLREFIWRLKAAGVDCVVDIRLNNTSQLAGFAKKDDLQFLLDEGFGIHYTHMPEFAPSEELLADYHKNKDWNSYENRYSTLLEDRNMVAKFLEIAKKRGWKRPCLLCSEDKSDKCHRRLLAEAVQAEVEELEVRHL